jgi:hypothetical protein
MHIPPLSRRTREYPEPMRTVWKLLGLAGVVGVAAGGVLVARDQRRRRAYTPNEIRDRLQQRLAEAGDGS